MKLQVVKAGVGARWVREGLQAFRRAPLGFISLFMLSMTLITLLSRIPLVGGVLAVALAPASTLAMMVATAQAAALADGRPAPGGRPLAALMFLSALQALRARARELAMLGVIYAVAVLAMGLLASALVGNPLAGAIDEKGAPRPDVIQGAAFQGAMLLRAALYLPIGLAFWHAPALVHWHGVPPVKSIFFSTVTCLRNFGAMAVYGLVWVGVMLLGSLVVSVVAAIAIAAAGGLGVGLMVGGSFVLMAMFLASTWFSFRDCFQAD